MWILGNLFSKNPTILYTIDNKPKEKQNNCIYNNTYNNTYNPVNNINNNIAIEDTDHLKRFFGMR